MVTEQGRQPTEAAKELGICIDTLCSWRLRPWKWHTAAASLQKAVPTRSAARCDVFAYLESFYNTRLPYSALGWIPPSRFEEELCHSVA